MESDQPKKWTIGPDIQPEDATRLGRIYDSVSKNIERENALINFRILWAVLLSAGIVAAEGLVINYAAENDAEKWQPIAATALVTFLSVLAAFFCLRSWNGVRAANNQMRVVKEKYWLYREKFDSLGFPRPFGDRADHEAGDVNATIFPRVMMMLWVAFSVVQFSKTASMTIDYLKEVETALIKRVTEGTKSGS